MRDALLDIDGVGPATADKILDVIDAHGPKSVDVSDDLARALEYFEADRPGYAEKYVRRAYEAVSGDE